MRVCGSGIKASLSQPSWIKLGFTRGMECDLEIEMGQWSSTGGLSGLRPLRHGEDLAGQGEGRYLKLWNYLRVFRIKRI